MSVVGYGTWRKSLATAQVKSDLNGVVAAMENARTFDNLYPLVIPGTMTASNGVTLSGGGSADGKTYCVDGTSVGNPTVTYYVDSWSGSLGAQQGTCASRPAAPAVPANLAVVSTTATQINLSWDAVAGATSYTEQCASNTAYTVGMKSATQATITGSVTGLSGGSVYYCHVKATNVIGDSAWSANVSTTTAFSWTWMARTAAAATTAYAWLSVASSADGTKLVASPTTTSALTNYIYTSTDSGATWTQRAAAGSRNWSSFASSSDGVKLAAASGMGATDYIYTSTDSGATWTQRAAAGSRPWVSIASSSDGVKLVAAEQNGSGTSYIYTSTDSGATWTQRAAAGARNWYSVASSSNGTNLVAVNYGGYAYTSTDSGATWTERTASGSRGWRGVASSADGTKLVAVPQRNVYSGVQTDYIFTSADSGATWTQRTAGGAREWFGVASSVNGDKLIASSLGYLSTSADFGATWTDQVAAGSTTWYGVASSSDGNKVVAGSYEAVLHTGVYGP